MLRPGTAALWTAYRSHKNPALPDNLCSYRSGTGVKVNSSGSVTLKQAPSTMGLGRIVARFKVPNKFHVALRELSAPESLPRLGCSPWSNTVKTQCSNNHLYHRAACRGSRAPAGCTAQLSDGRQPPMDKALGLTLGTTKKRTKVHGTLSKDYTLSMLLPSSQLRGEEAETRKQEKDPSK